MEIATLKALYAIFLASDSVCIDSRRVSPNSLFFALGQLDERGYHRGNAFALGALEAGARAVVVNDPDLAQLDARCFYVENGELALQELARWHRKQLEIPIVLIGGSNGKTTTKELAAAMLSKAFRVFATPGNLNNHLGLPLCLLQLRGQYDLALLEIGANHLGETRFLAELAQADLGLVTNCGKDHLGEYGSEEDVRRGNAELYEVLAACGGLALVHKEDEILCDLSKNISHIQFYRASEFEVKKALPLTLTWAYRGEILEAETAFYGVFWRENVAHALAIARYFGLDEKLAAEALAAYRPANLRSEWRQWQGQQVLLDCYNANPSSMALLVEALQAQAADNLVLVLGEMRELGPYEAEEHRILLEKAQALQGKLLLFGAAWRGIAASHFEDLTQLKAAIKALAPGHFLVLKGSRGNRLEAVLD